MASRIVSFTLNGRPIEVIVQPLTTLQRVLREQLGYTATKSGCRQGGCGSCTVLVNGEPMLACLLPAEEVSERQVLTLEGLSQNGDLDPLQQSFFENFAVQCGYCTPGMIMVSKALLEQNPHPDREAIVDALAGNYCRCTGYEPIIQAISAAVDRSNGSE